MNRERERESKACIFDINQEKSNIKGRIMIAVITSMNNSNNTTKKYPIMLKNAEEHDVSRLQK